MAPTLQDFNKEDVSTKQLRMDAFQPSARPSPAANAETINTIASYGAALDVDGQIDSVYQSITNQLSYSSSSRTLDAVLTKWRENDVQGSMDTMRNILIDPSIPDEQKQSILYGFQTGREINPISYNVGMSSLMADDVGENGEQEDMRVRLSTAFAEVDQYNAWVQKNLNVLNSENSPNFIQNVKRMVDSFIPFADAADQAFFESIVGVEGTGGVGNISQTLLLLGEGKERLRTTLARIPIEERKVVVQNIIDTIRSTNGSLANDTTTLKQIEALQSMIVPGAYNNTDRWVDNIFSVLDDTILLAPFSKGLRGLGGLVKGADQTRVAEETIARAERSASGLEPLPRSQSLAVIEEPAINAPDLATDVNNVIDGLDIEPTSAQIKDLRTLISEQMANPDGFKIDEVIERFSGVDQMTSTQITNLRQNLGIIQAKRTEFLNQRVVPPASTIAEVRARHVSSNVQPTSIASIYRNTNTSKARLAHNIILSDETDNAAQKLAGTSRQNALAHDYLPEIGGNGRVVSKIEYDEASSTPDTSIIKHVKDSESSSWADTAEKAEDRKAVANDWKNTIGISNRSAMGSIEDFDDGVKLKQVYGPGDKGFSNAYTAIDIVRTALRKYGVSDKEITVLSRQKDGTYAPITGKSDLNNGDFLIQVDYDYRFDPKNVEFSGYDVSPLWKFLRIPDIRFLNKEGGITQQIVPKSVNIDPRAYAPGVTAADKAAGIQRQFLLRAKEFGKLWSKLLKDQQIRVDDYIRKANAEEIPFNRANIRGLGISDEGIEVLSRWKQLQDTIGFFENADIARTLKDKGYEMFEHRASDTRLIAQPVARSAVPTNAEIYDVVNDSFIILSAKNIDELYEKGGRVVKPRKPEMINGRQMEYMLAHNDGYGAFSRSIRDDDRILNYRDGYYHVRYIDPYYITRRDINTGEVKVISRAETNRDARIEMQRLNDTQDGFEYSYKKDRADEAFDNHLDVAVNYGRSAQKLRGKRLERVKGSNDKGLTDSGIESPMDSLTRSISSISHRIPFRNVIDAEKRRWMSQWKSLTDQGQFPKSVDDIKNMPGATEARHAYRHIEQLSDGYGNMLDDLSKAFFSNVSEVAGSKGWGWADKLASKAARISPSTVGRLTAFKLLLAANPIRQLPLQAAPAIPIIASLNPLGFPKVIKQLGVLGAWHRGVDITVTEKVAKYGLNMKDTKDMLEAYELSGMSAAVNAHSFLSDDVARLADRNVVQQAQSFLGKPLRIAQNVGFDLGEQTLMSAVWLSEYDRMTRALKRTKLTGTERDALVSKVRALTGDMNKGGEMPYNSNSFSVIMQFLQTPHKIASGLILGHRSLTASERARVAAGYTLTFGVPVLPFINTFVDKLLPPEKEEAREIIKGGLANLALNRMLSSMSGEDVNVDFSQSLQPFSLEPLIDFAGNLLTLNVQDFVQGTAAVSLIANDGRINRFVRSVIDWMVPGSYESVDESKQVALTFLQMFSGLSNTMKAQHIMRTGQITTASGQVVDEDVSFMEALMKAAGFQTRDEVLYWAGNQAKWEIDGGIQKDIETLVDDLFTKYTRENMDVNELEQYMSIVRQAAVQFNEHPAYLERVKDYYTFKMRQNPQALYRLLLNSGLYTGDDVTKIINNSNFTKEQVDTLMRMYQITGESYGR